MKKIFNHKQQQQQNNNNTTTGNDYTADPHQFQDVLVICNL